MSVNSQNIVGLVGWSDSSVEVPHCQVGGGGGGGCGGGGGGGCG